MVSETSLCFVTVFFHVSLEVRAELMN